jgi:hypothetical protein
MATKAQIKAVDKFNREKTKSVMIRLNKSTDADIIAKLENVPSKMGYIKALIRKDLNNDKSPV